jgi:HEAT repeat protein
MLPFKLIYGSIIRTDIASRRPDMTDYINEADFKSLIAENNIDRLIEILERGGTRALQMEAADALGKVGDARAIPALIKMANHKWHWIGVRTNSIISLGRIAGPEAIEALSLLTEYKDFHAPSEDVDAIQRAAKTALSLLQ